MTCRHCQSANDIFSQQMARDELKSYRKRGPTNSTNALLKVIRAEGVAGLTLLDIGGGVGAIHHELIKSGVGSAVDVDASTAYIESSKQEAERQNHSDQISYQFGDFVDIAADIDAADIVTMDRVICCYPHVEKLVQLSSERAQKLYGVVYPRDNWLSRLLIPVFNFFVFKLRNNPFRVYIHSSQVIDSIIQQNGLNPLAARNVGVWRVAVYRR